MTNKISDQFSGVIVCQQKTDLKQPTLPCGLVLKTFCFSPDNVFWNSCIVNMKRWNNYCCRSEWAWSERTRQLSNRQKITLEGHSITFSYQTQGIVVVRGSEIYDAQWTLKELWLSANGRFRVRSGLPHAFFLHWSSTAIWIICNLVKV